MTSLASREMTEQEMINTSTAPQMAHLIQVLRQTIRNKDKEIERWVDMVSQLQRDGELDPPEPRLLLAEGAGRCGMKDTMVKSYECPICHEEITAEKLVILPEDEHELHEELLGNIGDHMFSCHEAKRTPDAEQLKARIAELEAELKAYKFALENAIIDRTRGGNTPLAQYVADAKAELNRQAQEERCLTK